MGQNSKIEFDIISGDDILIIEVVSNYNTTYKTDFEIAKFIYDEVVFARIQASKYKLSDIFELGNQFGGYAKFKREKGEIDW
jgi:predicted RNA-binding protein